MTFLSLAGCAASLTKSATTKQEPSEMSRISMLERTTREAEFTDESEARQYIAEQIGEGFHPSPIFVDGVCPRNGLDSQTWLASVEQQVYNGEITPAYRDGDRVVAHIHQADWQPVAGTVTKRAGHSLTIELDTPNPNKVRTLQCQDYEVSPEG